MYDCKAPLSRFYYPDTRRIINAFIIYLLFIVWRNQKLGLTFLFGIFIINYIVFQEMLVDKVCSKYNVNLMSEILAVKAHQCKPKLCFLYYVIGILTFDRL